MARLIYSSLMIFMLFFNSLASGANIWGSVVNNTDQDVTVDIYEHQPIATGEKAIAVQASSPDKTSEFIFTLKSIGPQQQSEYSIDQTLDSRKMLVVFTIGKDLGNCSVSFAPAENKIMKNISDQGGKRFKCEFKEDDIVISKK